MRTMGFRLIAGLCLILSIGVIVNVLLLQGVSSTHRDAGKRVANSAGGWFGQSQRSPAGRSSERSEQPARQLVSAVQRELQLRKYLDGRPDGDLDLATRAAIMAYEADHGYALTGEVNDALLRSILLGTGIDRGPADREIGAGAVLVIRHVQKLLIDAGYIEVEKTGRIDAQTAKAIERFERQHMLKPRGHISAQLLRQLEAKARAG